MKKCDFLKTLQWPDFETLWGNQGHNDVKHGINGSSGTFFFSGGLLRPVVRHKHNTGSRTKKVQVQYKLKYNTGATQVQQEASGAQTKYPFKTFASAMYSQPQGQSCEMSNLLHGANLPN